MELATGILAPAGRHNGVSSCAASTGLALQRPLDHRSSLAGVTAGVGSEDFHRAAATMLAKQIDAGCETCHSTYREQDPENRFKKGLVL